MLILFDTIDIYWQSSETCCSLDVQVIQDAEGWLLDSFSSGAAVVEEAWASPEITEACDYLGTPQIIYVVYLPSFGYGSYMFLCAPIMPSASACFIYQMPLIKSWFDASSQKCTLGFLWRWRFSLLLSCYKMLQVCHVYCQAIYKQHPSIPAKLAIAFSCFFWPLHICGKMLQIVAKLPVQTQAPGSSNGGCSTPWTPLK